MIKTILLVIFFSLNSFALKKIVERVNESNPEGAVKRDYFEYYPSLRGCGGRFGYRIVSELGSFEYAYLEEGKDLECEEYESLAEIAGKESEEKKQELLALLRSTKTIDTCIDLENEKEFFLQHYKDIINSNANELARELQAIDDNKSKNIQDVHNAKGFYGSMCAAGAATRDVSHFVILGNLLKGAGNKGQTRIVQEDGETIESCLDVKAYGDGSIEGFKIKVDNLISPDISFTYDNFKIPDAITIKMGSTVVASTGCVSKGRTKRFKIPAKSGTLTVNIVGDCTAGENEVKDTAWYFRLQCNKIPEGAFNNALNPRICYDLIDKYEKKIDEVIEKENIVINTYWAQAKCYAKAHGKLVSDFYGSEEDFMPPFITDDERLKSMMELEFKKFEKKDLKVSKPVVIPEPPKPNGPILPNYKEFKLNRFKYCGKRPPKEKNLFKTISFAYCFYGYLRLFDEKDPVFD